MTDRRPGKVRESGMPDQSMWEACFSPERILTALGMTSEDREIVDIGCGYGTFTNAAAELTGGRVHAVDIDADMVSATRRRAEALAKGSVIARQLDFMELDRVLAHASADYVMLFNILHAENPHDLLQLARRLLKPGGRVGVIHWRSDRSTPHGPPLAIRPSPGQVLEWLNQAGFSAPEGPIDLPPYHYGLVGSLPTGSETAVR